MPDVIEVEFHGKDVSDFQLSRLLRASHRKYSVSIAPQYGLSWPSVQFILG